MSYQGHCNCESIKVTLKEQPSESLLCHCHNCRRTGGLFSVNYVLDEPEAVIDDSNSALKVYQDKNTASGNTVQRGFCSGCGSPIFTKSPQFPGKVLVKANVFDITATPTTEVFSVGRETWLKPVGNAKQE
ncbi:uncharacterized protein K452DRAFT_315572 [Aplosporella prunicola CBS 121167]|uniref:CENP-V/GFA domain-containing protein n=1 Tax=Aplosporella prunicola CBS 121167 TaxID=1176127 RepID=A0A6A6BT01_9PEZI|nr:uncharacterized protein K452DRAFT_315572 [Aplosporella prunicola CBS 121167]KAF2146395.1 hypothetical protein K452DRAFT_315572 [Aplosporella prunicola CBS 121167]